MSGEMALVVLGAVGGGVIGWSLVPRASDALLRRAYRRAAAWWWDCWAAYRRFREDHPEREPSSTACGEEGALGMWRDDAVRAVKAGSLARERVQALARIGVVAGSDADAGRDGDAALEARAHLLGEEERRRRCTFAPRRWQRAGCAVGCAAAFAGMGWLGAAQALPFGSLALACCVLAMAIAVVCDLQARTVPLETCAVLAGAGALFQVLAQGFEGLAAGVLCAVVVAGGCLVANRLLGRRGMTAVGYGDVRCMAALSLACGAYAPLGFAVCYACAGAFSLAGLALRRLAPSDGIPMAPFLALWLACGAVASMAV